MPERRDIPNRRDNQYLRGRLDAIQLGYEKWTRYTVILLVILFLIQLGLGLLSTYLVGQNKERGDETRSLLAEVQANRKSSILTTCREQNARHDKTIDALNKAIDDLKPSLTKRELESLDQSVQANVRLIDALAPKQDCVKRTALLLKPPSKRR